MAKRSFLFLILISLLLLGSMPVHSYFTGGRWINQAAVIYQIDPQIGTKLGLSNTITRSIIGDAATQWNNASAFTLILNPNYNAVGNIVTVIDFRTTKPCPAIDDAAPGGVCLTYANADPNRITGVKMYLNSSTTYVWNTNGTMRDNTTPKQVDLLTVVLHEFGHWFQFEHTCSQTLSSVMCPNPNIAKQQLFVDDRAGATQMYGPYTGWEQGHIWGFENIIQYRFNIGPYPGGTTPELGRRLQENGVPVQTGSVYEMIAGSATGNPSYIHFRLFSDANGQEIGPFKNYVTIVPGMTLEWNQWNYQQSRMSMDFVTIDGATLRDSGLRDQNNISVHPAARSVYGTGQWYFFSIDLTPLAGKIIREWYIVYDNGGSGAYGGFRAYFDNYHLDYPSRGTNTIRFIYLPQLQK